MEIVEVELDSCVEPAETEVSTTCSAELKQAESSCVSVAGDGRQRSKAVESGAPPGGTASSSCSTSTSGALQLNKALGLSLEDPVKMMDSILNENGAISQNINLLGK